MHGSESDVEPNVESRIDKILSEMTTADLIGQLCQLDVRTLMEHDPTSNNPNSQMRVNQTALQYYIGTLGIGSIRNTVDHVPWKAHDYRNVAIQIQQTAHNHHRPPVLWGIDSIHGANYVHDATLTPQPLNLAATWNTSVAFDAGLLASRDTRAAGMNWLFAPLVGLALQPRWSRVYETFGEDPYLVGRMARSMIEGIQAKDTSIENVNSTSLSVYPTLAAACAKHFIGYSAPRDGHDRSPAWIPTRHLYQYFVPPWKQVLQVTWSVMESSRETDGVPMLVNPATLNYLLRQRLDYDGILLTDHQDIEHLGSMWHRIVRDTDVASYAMRETSVDVSMIPWNVEGFRDDILRGLNNGVVTLDRLRASVRRVLRLKDKLFDMNKTMTMDDPNLSKVGNDEALGLDMAHQSIVLTKNKRDFLPLSVNRKDPLKIHVTGPTSDSRIYQSGGGVYQWRGAPNESWFTYGSSVLHALGAEPWANVTSSCGIDILGHDCRPNSIDQAVQGAKSADLVFVCVGEEVYTDKGGDIRSLALPLGQYKLVEAISTTTNTPIVLVYFGGRPRLLGSMVDQADAVLIAFLPGPSAGNAIADLVSGRVNPSGRLPITYPLADDGGGSPYFHTFSSQCTAGTGTLPNEKFVPCDVQFPFGHGLSYTTFKYSDVFVSGSIEEDWKVSLKIKNTGNAAGSEVIMVFTFDDFRTSTPEYKRLRAFRKIFLEQEEELNVILSIDSQDLSFVGPHDDRHNIYDPNMTFWFGVGAGTDCRAEGAEADNLCVHIDLKDQRKGSPREYPGACQAACSVWADSGCSSHVGLSQYACLSMCSAVDNHSPAAMDLQKEGWGWNYVACLESVVTGFKRQAQLHDTSKCYKMTILCRDIFRSKELDQWGAGPHPTQTGIHGQAPVSYAIALLAGIISSLLMMHALFGRVGRSRELLLAEDDTLLAPYHLLQEESTREQVEVATTAPSR